jgi:hypothetical protein
MRTLFRTTLVVSAMAMGLPSLAAAQSFDGTYAGVSLRGSGNSKDCTTSSAAPRPLTIAGGNARVVLGAQGDIVFQGTVNAQGLMTLRSGTGALLAGKIDSAGNASGQAGSPACTYSMTWRKQ